MKNAIIIHGMPSKEEYLNPKNLSASHNHWFPWIQRQLILNGILAQTPEMSTPYDAKYTEWVSVFNQYTFDENTILVGHSLGAGFLVRFLSENNVAVGRVVLVAPWLDPDKQLDSDFFDFTIDSNLASKTKDLTVFISDDDEQEELTSVEMLKNTVLELRIKEFTGKGHFILQHMGTNEFPELFDYLLQ